MKKNIFSVAAVLVAGLFASCTVSAPKANLKGASQADSLSYAIGVVQSQGLKDYVVMRMGLDTTYMDQFIAGLCDGVPAGVGDPGVGTTAEEHNKRRSTTDDGGNSFLHFFTFYERCCYH